MTAVKNATFLMAVRASKALHDSKATLANSRSIQYEVDMPLLKFRKD